MKINIQRRQNRAGTESFRCYWNHPTERTANGRPKVEYSPTFDTEQEAEDYRTMIRAKVLTSGQVPITSRPRTPFRVVANTWFEHRSPSLARNTADKYQHAINFAAKTFGSVPIGEITRQQVQLWVNEAVVDPAEDCDDCEHTRQVASDDEARCRKHRSTKPLAPSSLASYYAVFNTIMQEAQLDGYLPNGCPTGKYRIKLPPAYGRMIFLTDEQVDHLLEVAVAQFPAHAAPVHLLAHTGMRVGEAMALSRTNYNPLAQWVDVVRSGRRQTTKTGKRRRIDLDTCCVEVVNAHLAGHESDMLFPGPQGGQQDVTNWRRRVWYPLTEAAGFGEMGLHIHDLRHSHCTSLLAAGWEVGDVADRLGHASSRMTQDRYGHVIPGRQARLIRERGMRAR